MPAGSLGRVYLDFMARENISVPSLLDLATTDPYPPMSAEEWRFVERSHVMHDLWHVVTGYGREEAGELCILALRSAQMRHIGVWALCLGGVLKVGRELGSRQVRAAAREAYARGRRAAWLYGVEWEAMLAEPLDTVRARLNLTPAVEYPIVGTAFAGTTVADTTVAGTAVASTAVAGAAVAGAGVAGAGAAVAPLAGEP
jgi:ubiquinone biosynthesis protein COQ4